MPDPPSPSAWFRHDVAMAKTSQQLRSRTAKKVGARAAETRRPSAARAPRSGLRDRARYAFDNSMSRGTPALVAWLGAVTLVLIVVFALITTLTNLRGEDEGFWKELFFSLNHALDAGFIGGDTGSWQFLLTMLVLTLAGLFIVSALIGVIAAGIDEKLAELRRGRSMVLESDHTVILGWSDSIFTIISELTIANESRTRPVVVVLAPRDKVEMEDDIRAKVPDLRGTRVICRSGSPMDIDDLRLSSHSVARSVILLAPESEDPDSEVIKSLLALTHSTPDGEGPRIVAEIRNPSNLEAARLVGTDRTVLLDIRDTVAKLLVQTSRQSGAAAVYVELFDYDGDEIYFLAEHDLAAMTYAEAQLVFEDASVIGLVDPDGPDGTGGPILNPPPATVIGDRTLIVVAEDDEGLGSVRSSTRPDLDALGTAVEVEPEPTQALLIGWNERAPIVLRELDKYAPVGSTLTVLTSYGDEVAGALPALDNLAVTVRAGATTDRSVLDTYVTADLDQVMVLCYSEHLAQQAADAKTLVTLLHVRDILGRLDVTTPVVSEMLDDRNRVLAEVAHVDDVVVSGEIISLLVTQLSEDQRLEAVFEQLLGDEGAEVYLRPADLYVRPGQVSWATVVAGATRRGETAIGFKTGQQVTVNPDKSTILDIGAGDRVVVLADS
jgi:voltage-gated potassium channel Kch